MGVPAEKAVVLYVSIRLCSVAICWKYC